MEVPQNLSRELEVARAVAREAAALVATLAGQPLEVRHKAEGEPVSRADLESSDLIVRRLAEAFPDDAILSEEMPDTPTRLRNPRVWMIDPIDGTRDFLRGESGYSVMIGLCVAGRPALGVVAQPATGDVWLGVVGHAAWKELSGGGRQDLRVSRVRTANDIRLVASKSNRTEYYARFCRALGITDDLAQGSVGLKVALVAQGSRDLYVYPGGHTKVWDSAAPEAILAAAGGKITDTHGNVLCYDRPDPRHPRGILASNGLVHEAALAAAARLRAEAESTQARG
ncbi:MAG: 3'(2'),5'-bisphosphate nucleotidase CysQ [Deltaproteobacteria bacterium]|nr:3'(2'),5'-bisphosphate nucleotidase CysQ [Deltaproteobacteria bacterium]